MGEQEEKKVTGACLEGPDEWQRAVAMHGAVRVNHNKLLRVTGEASAAELVGVLYARASKPTNASAASCPGAGGHNYKGASASAVLACLAGGNSWHQDDDGG